MLSHFFKVYHKKKGDNMSDALEPDVNEEPESEEAEAAEDDSEDDE